jgi:hypothetical protein
MKNRGIRPIVANSPERQLKDPVGAGSIDADGMSERKPLIWERHGKVGDVTLRYAATCRRLITTRHRDQCASSSIDSRINRERVYLPSLAAGLLPCFGDFVQGRTVTHDAAVRWQICFFAHANS